MPGRIECTKISSKFFYGGFAWLRLKVMVHERCVCARAEGNPALNQLLNLRQLLLTSLRLLRASRLGNNQTTRWTIKIVNRTANQKITLSALIRTPWSLIKTFVRVQAPRIHVGQRIEPRP